MVVALRVGGEKGELAEGGQGVKLQQGGVKVRGRREEALDNMFERMSALGDLCRVRY